MDFEAILTEAHNTAEAYVAAEVAVRPEAEAACDCGFAWIIIEGNGALARHCRAALKDAGEGLPGTRKREATVEATRRYGSKGYPKGWQFWKPGNYSGQSVRIHEAGARGFRDALARFGIRADVGSRFD